MKAYKVVNRIRKCSAVASGPKYKLTYQKGHVVEAPSDTLGIMCFKSLPDAFLWAERQACLDYAILEVQGLTKPRYPRYVSFGVSDLWLDRHYKRRRLKAKLWDIRRVPKGTVCFDKVKVGDEIRVSSFAQGHS